MSTKRQYSKQFKNSKQFKTEALELAESLGNIFAAARQLGISDGVIHAWKRQQNLRNSQISR